MPEHTDATPAPAPHVSAETSAAPATSGERNPPPALEPRSNWVRRFIVDYNPFFLLSAMSMLAGSLALTNSMSWSPVRLERILALTAAINVYELLLVCLGLFLFTHRNARRDGSILLILEAFFLVDVAFLNAELFAIDKWVGLWVNLIVFVITIAKLAAIFRVLRIPVDHPVSVMLVVELVALFALPGVLKFSTDAAGGRLPPIVMFGTWWALFAIGIATVSALRAGNGWSDASSTATRVITPVSSRLAWFAPLLTILAGVSLLAHAGTGQWVYDLRYWGANFAPMLALLAFILLPSPITRPAGLLAAIAAVFASLSYNATLQWTLLGKTVSPSHVTFSVVYLVLGWTLARRLFGYIASAGATVALVALVGPSIATIKLFIESVYERAALWIEVLRPKSQTQWGVIGVVMSFVFLAIGAAVSLRRPPTPQDARG